MCGVAFERCVSESSFKCSGVHFFVTIFEQSTCISKRGFFHRNKIEREHGGC